MKRLVPLFAIVLFASGCAAPQTKRYGWVTGLKPEKAAFYKDLHTHPWPTVNAKLKKIHIQNYSIYVRGIEGKLYQFSYLEYTGKDFAADCKKMAADPETQRWWKETDSCQQPPPDVALKGKTLSDAEEVYHLKLTRGRILAAIEHKQNPSINLSNVVHPPFSGMRPI